MLTRNLDKARKAFKKKDVGKMVKAHSENDHEHDEGGQYIKSIVYGGLDGIITTFAIVAGVAGASLSSSTILILGFANLIADGLSMAAGDYLSTKSEIEYQKTERKREEWEVENHPEGEKKEMIQIYNSRGFSKKDSKKLVSILSKNKKAWIDTMMVEELGILETKESPVKNAITTFISFSIFGFIPLLAYVLSSTIPFFAQDTFFIASFLTAATLFILGAAKVKITGTHWLKSGFEMLIVGGIAAIAAYGIGYLIAGIL